MTPLRLIQLGTSPVVLAYHIGPELDGHLRAVLPGRAIVASATPAASQGDLEAALALTHLPSASSVCLVGYSRGCQALREHLLRGAGPEAVVTIDGTHASLPAERWQIDVWTELAARARRGECIWIATCTQMSYVERLPPGTAGRAMSTRHVLERAAGTELPPKTELHHAGLHVLSYPSADIDHEAHVRQALDVLPLMLHRYIACNARHRPPWRDPSATLGERALDWSLDQIGIEEVPPGSGTGPEVRSWLAPCERDGQLLGLTAGEWCAAFACAAQAAGLLDGETVAHPYVAAGIELERHFKERGMWMPIADVRAGRRTSRPGDLAILQRGAPGSWQRHLCRAATAVVGGAFTTVGGNEADRVRLTTRRLTDPSLLGFGVVSDQFDKTPS